MNTNEIIQIFSGTVGTACFAVLFNIRGKRLVATLIGGFLSCICFILLNKIIPSEPATYFIVAVIISLYSEIIARVLKTPATPISITALIPLIPGGSLYYTMVSSFEGNFELFLGKAVNTLKIASSFALGIIVVTTLLQLFLKKPKIKYKSNN